MVNQKTHGDLEFRFLYPAAQRVFLVGDFNGWDKAALPMERMGDGWWTCRVQLPPGVYQFQYVADGRTYLDYAAFGLEQGPLGTWNSVVMVGPAPAASRRSYAAQPGTTAATPDASSDARPWTAIEPPPETQLGTTPRKRAHQLRGV